MRLETWKPVIDYEDTYIVSNDGMIKSIDRVNYCGYHFKEHIMTLTTDKNGYQRVYLTKNGKTKCKYVHTIVANAFIPNPNNLPQTETNCR